jgi:hypothetical protein
VLAAETVLMVKELITERYGEIRYTIGDGCSVARSSRTISRRPTRV